MAADGGAEANGIWLWGLIVRMESPIPHVAVRNRVINTDWGLLLVHALSCGSGLQVYAQQWELE